MVLEYFCVCAKAAGGPSQEHQAPTESCAPIKFGRKAETLLEGFSCSSFSRCEQKHNASKRDVFAHTILVAFRHILQCSFHPCGQFELVFLIILLQYSYFLLLPPPNPAICCHQLEGSCLAAYMCRCEFVIRSPFFLSGSYITYFPT